MLWRENSPGKLNRYQIYLHQAVQQKEPLPWINPKFENANERFPKWDTWGSWWWVLKCELYLESLGYIFLVLFRFGCFFLGFWGVAWGHFQHCNRKHEKTTKILPKRSKHTTSCQPFICPLAQTGVQWNVRYIIEFDFLNLSAGEEGTAIPVPGCWLCCLCDEVSGDTLREDPNFSHQFLSHLRHNIAGNFQEYPWSHLVIWNAT